MMKKESIRKEDGRLLVYYWFDRNGADSGKASADATAEATQTLQTTNQVSSGTSEHSA